MSDVGYLIWFVAMAVVIVLILTAGVLEAAGLLNRKAKMPQSPPRVVPEVGTRSAPTEPQELGATSTRFKELGSG